MSTQQQKLIAKKHLKFKAVISDIFKVTISAKTKYEQKMKTYKTEIIL